VSRQVVQAHAAASLAMTSHHCLGDGALVEGWFAALGQGAQAAGQAGIAEQLAGFRAAPINGQLAAVDGPVEQALGAALPVVRGDGSYRKSFFGQLNRRGQAAGQGQAPKALYQVAPGGGGPGHGDGIGMVRRQGCPQAFPLQALQAKGSGGPAPSR